MRQSHSKARRCEPERESSGTHHATRLPTRVDPLTLPHLELGPTDIVPSRAYARLALQLMDAGYIDNDDSRIGISSPDLVAQAFNRCIEMHKGETPLLTGLEFFLHVESPPELYSFEEEWDEAQVEETFQSHWFYTIETCGMNSRLLEPRFNYLEAKAPGLFRAALNILDRCVNPIIRSGSPNSTREVMEEHQWGGCDDNDTFFEEYLCINGDEMEYEGVSPLAFREGLPEWLIQPMSVRSYNEPASEPAIGDQVLGEVEINGYAQHADPEVAAIAQCLLDLISAAKSFDEAEFEVFMLVYRSPVHMMSLLRWNKKDNLQRAYDNFIDDASANADCFTYEITQTFVGRDDESFKKWIKGFEATLTILNRANTLIGFISVSDDQ